MMWIWMLAAGFVAGVATSELGWTKWIFCKLRRNCKDKCPVKGSGG